MNFLEICLLKKVAQHFSQKLCRFNDHRMIFRRNYAIGQNGQFSIIFVINYISAFRSNFVCRKSDIFVQMSGIELFIEILITKSGHNYNFRSELLMIYSMYALKLVKNICK